MIENRPGGHSFQQRLLSRKQHTVGKQITVEQLIEKRKVMTTSKAMIMNIGITSVTSRSKVNYSHLIGVATRLMQKHSMIESPSGGVPKKAPRWDLTRSETCDAGKLFLAMPLGFLEYLRIYMTQRRFRGVSMGPQAHGPPQGAPLRLVASSRLF